jgi:hypothetical protein
MKKDSKNKIIFDIIVNILGMAIVIGFILFASTNCSDETYIAGYNKDFEEINQQIFEVDSLLMRIQMDLDSLNAQ